MKYTPEGSSDLKSLCRRMLMDLSTRNQLSKDDLFLKYVHQRLDKSFTTYQQEMDRVYNYLQYRNELNLLKKMNKI